MVSGILSVGVGILFAVTQDMKGSLFTLFRVSHLTGALVRLLIQKHTVSKCYMDLEKFADVFNRLCVCASLQFFIAGVVSNLLFKYPTLLPVSLKTHTQPMMKLFIHTLLCCCCCCCFRCALGLTVAVLL